MAKEEEKGEDEWSFLDDWEHGPKISADAKAKMFEKPTIVWHVGRFHLKFVDVVSKDAAIKIMGAFDVKNFMTHDRVREFVIKHMKTIDMSEEWKEETLEAIDCGENWWVIGPEGLDIFHGIDLDKDSSSRFDDVS